MSARRALIVANDTYDHEGLSHLLAPGADAEALSAVLGDPAIGGFEVRVVRNEPAHVIREQVEDLFAESRPDDVLLLHFSCHGLKGDSGELFFATRNTRPNRLGSTAVSADFVQQCMRATRSRSVVLLLDCCYGGAFSRGVKVRAAGDANVLDSFRGGGRGRAVITASSAMEYAFEGDQLSGDRHGRPSVFTSALVEGLSTGDADRDRDGWISLNELYDYIYDRVRERTPHQTPSRDVEMQGELYLARSPRAATGSPDRGADPPPPTTPSAEPSLSPPRPERPWVFAAAATALVAAAAVVVALLVADDGTGTGMKDGPLPPNSFIAEAPWRLDIDHAIQGPDPGCDVTVTHEETGRAVPIPKAIYSPVRFQVRDSGAFRWTANDPGCLTVYRGGAGDAKLPFTAPILGDTDVFEAGGPVTVEITNDYGNHTCDVELRDADDGRPLAVKEVPFGGPPATLDPLSRSKVYIHSLDCVVKVSQS